MVIPLLLMSSTVPMHQVGGSPSSWKVLTDRNKLLTKPYWRPNRNWTQSQPPLTGILTLWRKPVGRGGQRIKGLQASETNAHADPSLYPHPNTTHDPSTPSAKLVLLASILTLNEGVQTLADWCGVKEKIPRGSVQPGQGHSHLRRPNSHHNATLRLSSPKKRLAVQDQSHGQWVIRVGCRLRVRVRVGT